MAKKRLNPSIKRSRTRSGCLTCRDRHVKCDEQHPVCKNCIKSKRKCYRGIRLNFTQYTIYNPEQTTSTVGPIDPDGANGPDPHIQRDLQNLTINRYQPTSSPSSSSFKLLDQSITIASLYENGRQSYEPYIHLHQHEDLRESDLQFQQDICSSFSNLSAHSTYSADPTHSTTNFNSMSNARSGERKSLPQKTQRQQLSPPQPQQQHYPQHHQHQHQEPHQHQEQQHHQQQLETQSILHQQNPPRLHNEMPSQTWQTSFPQHDSPARSQSQNFDNNLILENFDITKYLLQDNFIIMNQNIGPSTGDNLQEDSINSPLPQGSPSNTTSTQLPHLLSQEEVVPVDPQLSNLVYSSSQVNSEITKYDIDVNKLIILIQYQKYYWILDLFNDLQIWKLIIPNYCLKLSEVGNRPFMGGVQQHSLGDNSNNSNVEEDCKLLINCLLHCYKDDIFTDLTPILNQQLKHWNKLRNLEINTETYPAFERLLVSIVLLLLNLFMRLQQRANMTHLFVIILNNQAKIFNKITSKLAGLSEWKSKSGPNIILISTLHSISLLKYFIRKQISYNLLTNETSLFEESWIVQNDKAVGSNIHDPAFEDYMELISYDETDVINSVNRKLNEFIKLNRFESAHLSTLYQTLDFPQISYKTKNEKNQELSESSSIPTSSPESTLAQPNTSEIKSHASKLREIFWYLVRSDYALRNPKESTVDVDQSSIFHELTAIIELKDGNKDMVDNIRLPASHHGFSSHDSPKIKFEIPQQEQQIQRDFSNSTRSLPLSQSGSGEGNDDETNQNSKLVFPNERGIAIQVTREYINKLRNRPNPEALKSSNEKITTILSSINDSKMDIDIKNQWMANFEWTLGFI